MTPDFNQTSQKSTSVTSLGVFGKLPAHGDFVERNLAKSFLGLWDEWLQRSLATSRDVAGESWLDFYLTSPVWYFSLGHGVIDVNPWVGAIVPSVDSVGRYFPFTVTRKLNGHEDPFQCLARNLRLFEQMAHAVIDAMQQGLPVDNLWQQLQAIDTQILPFQSATRYIERQNVNVNQQPHGDLSNGLIDLSYSHTRLISASSSLWHCAATEEVPATTFTLAGLPNPEFYWAMLSNDWAACDD
jgi:type VI secretion system protein ImpM